MQKGLTSALTDQGPCEFAVSGAGDNYIDLANPYLFVEAHITVFKASRSRVFAPFLNKGMAL
jgi:hypothetical protein